MGRNHLANAVVAAVGYNFRRLLASLELFVTFIQAAVLAMLGQVKLRSAT